MNNGQDTEKPKGNDKKACEHQKTVITCFFFYFRLVMSQPRLSYEFLLTILFGL